MAKDDFDPKDFGFGDEPKTQEPARQKVGPMRRTHRPTASAEVQQALDAQLLEAHGLGLEDHEKRLRDLEAFKWKLMGACLAAGGMGAGLTKLLGG